MTIVIHRPFAVRHRHIHWRETRVPKGKLLLRPAGGVAREKPESGFQFFLEVSSGVAAGA